jgi:hypothetical protein
MVSRNGLISVRYGTLIYSDVVVEDATYFEGLVARRLDELSLEGRGGEYLGEMETGKVRYFGVRYAVQVSEAMDWQCRYMVLFDLGRTIKVGETDGTGDSFKVEAGDDLRVRITYPTCCKEDKRLYCNHVNCFREFALPWQSMIEMRGDREHRFGQRLVDV